MEEQKQPAPKDLAKLLREMSGLGGEYISRVPNLIKKLESGDLLVEEELLIFRNYAQAGAMEIFRAHESLKLGRTISEDEAMHAWAPTPLTSRDPNKNNYAAAFHKAYKLGMDAVSAYIATINEIKRNG